jgi:hypothetical protein
VRGCVSLYWLTYRSGGHVLGVIILEATDLLHARFRANLEGLDRDADFSEGHELDDERAAAVPKDMIGRMLTPAEAARLIERMERAEPSAKPRQTRAERTRKPNGPDGPASPRRRPRKPRVK